MEEKLCFVIMGFGKKTDYASSVTLDLDKTYNNVIKPIVTECGYKCVRADEIRDNGLIDRSMYALLLMADLVIADISTLNPNALYELGVRHAVKPFSTIIMRAESTAKIPFDIDHTRIISYQHLCQDIGVDEAERVKRVLKERLLSIGNKPMKDSPVYEYLTTIVQPTLEIEEYNSIVGALAEKNDCIFALTERAKRLMQEEKFGEAIKYWKKASEKNPSEPYYIQQLALCTYKQDIDTAQQELVLNDALLILEKLADANDPETHGLRGAIYKRLSAFNGDNVEYLNRAITNYEKGYMCNYDFYTGENFAFCLDKMASITTDDNEKIYSSMRAKKIRQDIYDSLSSKLDLEIIDNIPNLKWMSATLSICCYTLEYNQKGHLYENKFRELAEAWEINSYDQQKAELEQLLEKKLG